MALSKDQNEYVDDETGISYVTLPDTGGCCCENVFCAFVGDANNCKLSRCTSVGRNDSASIIWIKKESENA